MQYDSDDEDLAVFSPGRAPPTSTNSYAARPPHPEHFASNADPFANGSSGAYDSFDQNQNPGAYGGGQAENRFGTGVNNSTQAQGTYDDTYEPY